MRSFLALSSSLLFVALSAPAQVVTLPLWPNGTPESWTPGPEVETMKPTDKLVGGHSVSKLSNIEQPTLALFQPPKEKRTGAAVVVFPGGAYRILAYDLEGTEVCQWLNAEGIAHYELRQEECGETVLRFVPDGSGPTKENLAEVTSRLSALLDSRHEIQAQAMDVLLPSPSGKFRLTCPVTQTV